jgi:hypothetical protein
MTKIEAEKCRHPFLLECHQVTHRRVKTASPVVAQGDGCRILGPEYNEGTTSECNG